MLDAELYRIESLGTPGEYTPVQARALDSFASRQPDARVTGWLRDQHGPLIICPDGDWLTITPQGHTRIIARHEYSA